MWGNGETSLPENAWDIADRQDEDRARSKENAADRQRIEWAEQGRGHQGAYTEPGITINNTRRWSGDQDR